MKKVEKCIYIVMFVIIIGVLLSSLVFAILSESDEFVEEIIPTDNEVTENNEKEVTLTDDELEDYLSYVPGGNYAAGSFSIYATPTNVDAIDKLILLANAMDYAHYHDIYDTVDGEGTTYTIKASVAKKYLEQLYNINLDDLSLTIDSENEIVDYGCSLYYYNQEDEFYITGGCGGNYSLKSTISSYEITKDGLIIYEYYTLYTWFDEDDEVQATIEDLYTGKIFEFDYGATYSELLEEVKDELSLYKHTYKYSEGKYYWYSTETV